MLLPTTLTMAAAAAVVNLWLMIRVGQLRARGRILYGDGGDEMLIRRMRAHANFIESAPLVLILIAAIELSGKGDRWLAIVGAAFILGRVSHAIGMDGRVPFRSAGALVTMLTLLGLAVAAVLAALGKL